MLKVPAFASFFDSGQSIFILWTGNNSMEVCPKCRKPVEARDHMTLAGSRPISQVECECGYYGLPVQLEKDDSKKD
jgi:hypothetical protein